MTETSNNGVPENLNRSSFPFSGDAVLNAEDLSTANEMVANAIYSRMQWMAGLMDPKRDIYKECGYPVNLVASDYRTLYDRDAISARVVQLLPKESWQVQPMIYDDEDPEVDTAFEADWIALHQNLRARGNNGKSWYKSQEGSPIWDYLLRLDILCGIGHYGVMLLGIDDGRPLNQPLEQYEGADSQPPGTEGMYGAQPLRGDAVGYDNYTTKQLVEQGIPSFAYPVPFNVDVGDKKGEGVTQLQKGYEQPAGGKFKKTGKPQLLFLKVFDETIAQITRYERDPHNPRFGLPQMYLLTFNDPRTDATGGAGLPVASAHCHWSRVIHVADQLGSNDTLGYPRLKQVWNRVWDTFKTYGAAGEAYWQQCFSMLSLETNPALGADFTIDQKSISDQLGNIRNKLQRQIVLAGMTAKTLPPNAVAPTPYLDVFIEAICVFLGCPVRVFKGSERGELASSQDDSSWNDRLRHRQMFFITPKIIVPFIDRLIEVGVLSEPEDGYSVMWPDLEALGDKDKAAIALQMVQAMTAYISGQCENLMTPLDFMVNVLKLPHDLAKQMIESAQQAAEAEEQKTIASPDEQAEQQQTQTDAGVPTHEKADVEEEDVEEEGDKEEEDDKEEEVAANSNPNHDALGRFSSVGGHGAGSRVSAPKGPPVRSEGSVMGGGRRAPSVKSGPSFAVGDEVAGHILKFGKAVKITPLQKMKVAALNSPSALGNKKIQIPEDMIHKREGNKYVHVENKKEELRGMFPGHRVEFVKYQPAHKLGLKEKPAAKEPVKIKPPEILSKPNQVEDVAKSAAVTSIKALGGGVNGSYVVTLDNGLKGVWKPKSQEATGMRIGNIPDYTSYRREAAAYSVAKAIGLDDLVPVTVQRIAPVPVRQAVIDNPERQKWRDAGRIGVGPPRQILNPGKPTEEIGSIQLFATGAKAAGRISQDAKYDGDKDLARACAFDMLIGNTDRHDLNWMIKGDTVGADRVWNPAVDAWAAAGKKGSRPPDYIDDPNYKKGPDPKLVLIDHGLAFPTNPKKKVRSWMMGEAARRNLKIPKEVLDWDEGKIVAAARKEGLEDRAIDALRTRLQTLKKAASLNLQFKYRGIESSASKGLLSLRNEN